MDRRAVSADSRADAHFLICVTRLYPIASPSVEQIRSVA
jgi:hypothetical protein